MGIGMKTTKPEKENGEVALGRIGNRPIWVLHGSNVIRTIHQIGGAVFLTSYLLKDAFILPSFFLILVLMSGCLLFIAEGIRHRQIFRELTGVMTFLKLILLGFAFHGYWQSDILVLIAFVLASMSSHAPRNIRHRILL